MRCNGASGGWRLYGDAELDALVARLNVSNQNVAAAEAQFRQARALVRGARSQLFPILSGNAGVTRSAQGSSRSDTTSGSLPVVSAKPTETGLSASWEADIWGRLRRNLKPIGRKHEASAADLAAARLSLQAELVQTYLQLQVIDEHRRLLDQTLKPMRARCG